MELLWQFIIRLYQDVPQYVYEGLLSVACIGTIVVIVLKGGKKGIRYSMTLLLIEYISFVLLSTVVYRTYNEEQRHDFTPFWSYEAIKENSNDLIIVNIMNVAVFVPIGFLVGLLFRSVKLWQVICFGSIISLLIEVMQFVLKRGFSEFDDVMHNTLGCLIGYGIISLIRKIF